MKIFPKPTKWTLTHFSKENYSPNLMLSEFIDNSISSWEKNDINFEKINNLTISIEFNEELKILENQKEESYRKLIIKDNANGMTYEEMEAAANFYDIEGKESVDLNQHGIGLKSAIGWFGEDALIYSQSKDESWINELKIETSTVNDKDEWGIDLNKIFNNKSIINESGTIIQITSISREKFNLVRDNEDFIFAFLGWKYRYYIEKGLKIKIFYTSNDDNYKALLNDYVGPFSIKPWKLSDFISLNNKKIEKYNEKEDWNEKKDNFKNSFINSIENILRKSNPMDFKFKVCTKIIQDEEVFLSREIKIGENTYSLSLGIITSNSIKYFFNNVENNEFYNDGYFKFKKNFKYSDLQGVSTFHHNRGIDIGPYENNLGKSSKTFYFSQNKRQTTDGESSPIRLYGEIHLNNFKTEINKSTLYWNENQKNDFEDELSDIWKKDFREILKEIIESENTIKRPLDNAMKQSDIDKVAKSFYLKTNQNIELENEDYHSYTENKNHMWTYKNQFKGKNYIFNLIEEKKNNKPFHCSRIDSTSYDIYYDFNHPIWNPINKDNGVQSRKLIHPIITTLALAQWIIEANNRQSIAKPSDEDLDIFSIIDELVKNWKQE